MNLADSTITHQLRRYPELLHGALLRAHLKGHIGFFHQISQLAALLDCERRRLLEINVLTSQYSLHGRLRMPVVRCTYNDSVYVLVQKHFLVIAVLFHIDVRLTHFFCIELFNVLLPLLHALAVEI